MHRILRIIVVLAAVGICWALVRALGAGGAVAAWGGIAAVACALSAILLRTSPAEQITWKNRVAGCVLQWGYSAARGKLVGIALISWLIWTIGGAVVIWDLSRRMTGNVGVVEEVSGNSVRGTILIFEWIFDGIALLVILGMLVRPHQSPNVLRTRLMVLVALIGMLGGSVLLWKSGAMNSAMVVASPPVVMGLMYGVFILVVVVFGRNARWN